jgi:hypothetical protein
LIAESGSEIVEGFAQVLYENPLPRQELGNPYLSRIARNDMEMQMIDARACDEAHVVPDVVSRRRLDPVEDAKSPVDEAVELASLFRRKVADIDHVPLWEDDEVAGIIGIEVEGYDEGAFIVDDEAFDFFRTFGYETENAAFGALALEVAELFEVEEILHHRLLAIPFRSS